MSDESAKIAVRLRPRGRADELLGMRDGVLQARVAAAPVEGKANRRSAASSPAVGVPPSRVVVVRGEKSRDKLIRVEGIDLRTLGNRLKI